MSQRSRYLLDADSFIRSKREHYAFDFCPAYWDALMRATGAGRLLSIEPIRQELLRGKDALTDWVRQDAPRELFAPVDGPAVQEAFKKVIGWAQDHPQFAQSAKQVFAKSADPWLIAFAAALGDVLVTYEVSAPTSKAKIKLPDAAAQFNVSSIPPYVMLRQLGVRFELGA